MIDSLKGKSHWWRVKCQSIHQKNVWQKSNISEYPTSHFRGEIGGTRGVWAWDKKSCKVDWWNPLHLIATQRTWRGHLDSWITTTYSTNPNTFQTAFQPNRSNLQREPSLSLKTKDGIIFALLDPLSTFVQSCNRSISNKSPCFQSLYPLFPSWVSRHHPINQIKTVRNHPNLIQVFPCSQNRRRNDSPTVKFRSPCEPPPAEEAYQILCPGIEFPPPKRAFFHGSC